jgi:hypothetical protein
MISNSQQDSVVDSTKLKNNKCKKRKIRCCEQDESLEKDGNAPQKKIWKIEEKIEGNIDGEKEKEKEKEKIDEIKRHFLSVERKMKDADPENFKDSLNSFGKYGKEYGRCRVCKSDANSTQNMFECRKCKMLHHGDCSDGCFAHSCFICGLEGKINEDVVRSCVYCPVSFCNKHYKPLESGQTFDCPICEEYFCKNY